MHVPCARLLCILYVSRVLATVADFQDPRDDDDARLYRLREELWGEVDPLFLRFSKADRAAVAERLQGKPPPRCATDLAADTLWPTFAGLPAAVYQSGVLHRIVFTVVLQAVRCAEDPDAHDMYFAVQPLLHIGLQALLNAVLCPGERQPHPTRMQFCCPPPSTFSRCISRDGERVPAE